MSEIIQPADRFVRPENLKADIERLQSEALDIVTQIPEFQQAWALQFKERRPGNRVEFQHQGNSYAVRHSFSAHRDYDFESVEIDKRGTDGHKINLQVYNDRVMFEDYAPKETEESKQYQFYDSTHLAVSKATEFLAAERKSLG